MTLGIAHKEGDVAILDCIREIRAPFSPEGATAEFADVLKTYKLNKVTGDRYAGQWPVEAFARHNVKYLPSEAPKGMIYLDCLPLINSAKVRLLANTRMIAQLVGLERNTARGGKDSIDHAKGGHDNVANAVAGALLLAVAKRPQLKMGAIDFAGTGKVSWRDEDAPRLRMDRDEAGNLVLRNMYGDDYGNVRSRISRDATSREFVSLARI